MVYVQSGRVLKERPWGLKTITDFFWGIILFIIFLTLVGFNSGNSGPSSYNRGGGSGGSGGGGPGGGPRGPRTIGRFKTIQDCSMPGGG